MFGFNLRFGSKVKTICAANRIWTFLTPCGCVASGVGPTRCTHASCVVHLDQSDATSEMLSLPAPSVEFEIDSPLVGDSRQRSQLFRLAKTAKADQTQVEFDRSSFVYSEVI